MSGELGIAVTTSSIAVGARCPHVRAGVGAVTTQNITLPSIGPAVLDHLAAGADARAALAVVMDPLDTAAFRQVAVIDAAGRSAVFSGARTLGVHATAQGRDCAAAGNLLADAGLPAVMVRRFEHAEGPLAARLVAALRAGLEEGGGEMGPVRSAALLVAGAQPWPLVDLRVDWDEDDPVARIEALWRAYEPQMRDYVTRALDPASAPAFGVPGDE